MRAEGDSYANDSVHVQFSDSVTATGAPTMQIGTTSSAVVVLQNGDAGARPQGWGWADNGWNTLGAPVYFAATGTHTIRIQQREDGALVDQIVLRPDAYISTPPGARLNDSTVWPASGGSTAGDAGTGATLGPGDILLHAAAAPIIVGNWSRNADATAATGASLLNPNLSAAKVTTPSPAPADYFEMTFDAPAGTAYRLWVRGKATADSWANDSVFVQFGDSVDAAGAAIYRIATANATTFSLEQCSGCGIAGWGWEDNGWGQGVAGPLMYFATSGTHTIRVQVREDGLALDQILLSPQKYLNAPPGGNRNDATILR